MRSMIRVLGCVLGSLLLVTGVGCQETIRMKAFDVKVALSKDLRNSTVLVDLVGVSPGSKTIWGDKDLTDYWSANDREGFRRENKQFLYTMEFAAGASPGRRTLTKHDPVWLKWKDKGARWLFILADLPRVPQRNVIPLAGSSWDVDTIKVRVTSAGIFIDTAQKESN